MRERLMPDVRLQCVEDSLQLGFWVYWGDPALDDAYGTLCFGDIELKQGQGGTSGGHDHFAAGLSSGGSIRGWRRGAKQSSGQFFAVFG